MPEPNEVPFLSNLLSLTPFPLFQFLLFLPSLIAQSEGQYFQKILDKIFLVYFLLH